MLKTNLWYNGKFYKAGSKDPRVKETPKKEAPKKKKKKK